jgi:hypothetical protein
MSNPTNRQAPSDISQLRLTDFRPSKALYINVKNNNDYRNYMQNNGKKILDQQMTHFMNGMAACGCEKQDKSIAKYTPGYVCPRNHNKK